MILCVDEEIQLDGFIELPSVAMDEEEPQDERDSYLESMLTEDLSDVDDMAWRSHCPLLAIFILVF